MSAHTVKAYTADVSRCVDYAMSVYGLKETAALDHLLIRSWLGSLMTEGLDARSVRRKISSLNTYFKYLMKHGLVQVNPMLKVSSPKVSKKLPVFIEEKKMNTVIGEIIDEKKEADQQLAGDIVLTLYHTGIRLSELIHLEKRHISLPQSQMKVLGKRNKERIIPVTEELNRVLAGYLELHPQSPWVFNTAKGEQLYPNYVYRSVRSLLSGHSTLRKKSPHVLRHTFATHMLNNGSDLNAIKELLGHANLSATQVYTHNSVERLKMVHRQAHPKGNKRNH